MPTTTTITSADGTRLRLSQWNPVGIPLGDVLLIHGFAEHMGRYDHVAEELTDRGFTVHGLELRGHGGSGGARGHVMAWSDYGADIRAALGEIARPAFLVCHSMGGLATIHAVLERSDDILGVVISNPLLGTAFEPAKIKVFFGKILSRIMPSFNLPGEVDDNHISRDPMVVAAYKADPLVFHTFTARWGMEMLKAQDSAQARASEFKLPLLLLVSEGDKICSAQRSQDWFAQVASSDKQIKVYEELYHELFNEPEKQNVLDDVCEWLEAHNA